MKDEHVRDEHVKDAAQDVAEDVTQDAAEDVLGAAEDGSSSVSGRGGWGGGRAGCSSSSDSVGTHAALALK